MSQNCDFIVVRKTLLASIIVEPTNHHAQRRGNPVHGVQRNRHLSVELRTACARLLGCAGSLATSYELTIYPIRHILFTVDLDRQTSRLVARRDQDASLLPGGQD